MSRGILRHAVRWLVPSVAGLGLLACSGGGASSAAPVVAAAAGTAGTSDMPASGGGGRSGTGAAGGSSTGASGSGAGGATGWSGATGGADPAGGSAGMAGGSSGGGASDPHWDAAVDPALRWLASVKQPNGLYNSQADLDNVCYTYDQAVAAVALLAAGQAALAQSVLNSLKSLQDATGFWHTAYARDNSVAEKDEWLGPVAWVALAAAAYRTETGSSEFDDMANRALTWAVTFQQPSGGIMGGKGPTGKNLNYTSTEENEDAYAALTFFGMAGPGSKVLGFLGTVWSASDQHWLAGPGDSTIYLDVNSWGVMSLLDKGPPGYAQALDYNLAHLRLTKTVAPLSVDGFDFNDDKDDVWLEGTAQMAGALYAAGRLSEGDHFVGEVAKAQRPDGGIPYSMAGGTTGDDWNMPKSEAVSSTAWFILAAKRANPFHYAKR